MSLCEVPDLPEGVPPLRAFYLYMCTGCNLKYRHCWITPTFVNGKPMLHPRFMEIADMLTDMGMGIVKVMVLVSLGRASLCQTHDIFFTKYYLKHKNTKS